MKPPVKMICLIGQLGTGGTEKQLYLFLKHLDRDGISPTVVVSSNSGSNKWEDEIKALSIPVISLRGKSRISKLFEFRKIVSKLRADTVFSWSFYTNSYFWACPRKIRFTGSLRNELALVSKELPRFHLACSLHVPHLIVNSILLKEELLAKGVDGGKISLVNNIIEKRVEDTLGKDADIRKEHNIPENAIVVAGMGRNAFQKDFDFFIDVFAKASSANPRLHGMILGSGGTAMLGKIRELGLENKFTVPGEVKAVMSFLKASDIFFLSSKHEGMANVLLEALQAACSILTSNVGGCRDVFENCESGMMDKIILNDRNPDTAAAKLLYLAENGDVKNYLNSKKDFIISKFSPGNIMPGYYKALGLDEFDYGKITV